MDKRFMHILTAFIIFVLIFFYSLFFNSCTENGFDPDINLTPEINIKQGDSILENGGGEFYFGLKIADGNEGHSSEYISFTIENTGIRDLAIEDISLYAGNTADFDLTNTTTSPVVSSGYTSFIIRFDPVTGGNKEATVLVDNNDPDESSYTFLISGSTEQRVYRNNGVTGDRFGHAVSVSQGNAVIGVPYNDETAPDAGAALVYSKTGITWEETQILTAGDGLPADKFGHAVAIEGTTIVIGAPGDDVTGIGAAYVFTYSGSGWEQTGKLIAQDGVAGDHFGYAVALSGNFAFIGAPDKLVESGAVYVFSFNGGNWDLLLKLHELNPPSPSPGDKFGYSITAEGNHVLVGSPFDDDQDIDAGAVHAFFYDGALWNFIETITASDGFSSDQFGTALSISNTFAFIGSPGNNGRGAGYIFSYNDTTWVETGNKLLDPGGSIDDEFGSAGTLSGGSCIIGSYNKDENGPGSGAAFLYEYSGSTWDFVMKISPPDGEPNDTFGYALSLSGDDGIISAPQKEISGEQRGAVYIYGL